MNLHGFELLREETVEEINSTARVYRHMKTGAELLTMANDDENKSFGISFRTPPADSTGIAHIMEHAVLGGSHKYPVKEPFVELVKGSFKTFLNAITYPDKTVYPVASTNLQDFYNLVDVYLDAVFHPLITPHHLQQEGWHYELNDPNAPLIYKGVVFNEMKGAYSSPDSLLYRHSKAALFPDNAYAHDSGGDPRAIPDLTYEQFKAFHETYYHPSNALIYFYGDDPEEERLRLLATYLDGFEAREVVAAVGLQRPFTTPQEHRFPFSVEAGSQQAEKGMVQVNWLLPENDDAELTMALSILSYALVSTNGSPLRKVLLDSRLGEDLTGGGLGTGLRQLTFAVGMKGVALPELEKVPPLILETLGKIAEEGIDPDMVEAALNTFEFSLRENNTGSFPRGLNVMFRALRTWLYGQDPLAQVRFEGVLTAVKHNLATNPTYLQDLIGTHLLDNPHRVTVVLEPDAQLNARQEAEEKAQLQAVRDGLNDEDVAQVIADTQTLRQLQERADDPEALAALPMLTLGDLDKQNKEIPITFSQAHGVEILYHDLFTNGIVYLDVGFDLRALPLELMPYVDLFTTALTGLGTSKEDYVKLSQRIGRETGGVWASTYESAQRGNPDGVLWLFVRGKGTLAQTGAMLDIMREILLTTNFDNQERFRQIVLRAKAGHEAGLIPGGHGVVNGRLRAKFDTISWISEQTSGIDGLFFLRGLLQQIEQDWPSVVSKLERIRTILLNRNRMIANVTVEADGWSQFEPQLIQFLASFPAGGVELPAWSPLLSRHHEGLTMPAQVNYVAKGSNLYELGYELHGSISVITGYLRTTWLWEKIRVQGGAYGGMMNFNQHSGVLTYLSYRDPNLLRTVQNYDETAVFLRKVDLNDRELTRGIIGAISSIDSHQLPDAKGRSALYRHLLGLTPEMRQQYRDEVLGTTAANFRALADVLDGVRDSGVVVVLGSPEAIAAANEGDWMMVSKVM